MRENGPLVFLAAIGGVITLIGFMAKGAIRRWMFIIGSVFILVAIVFVALQP